MKSKRAIPDNNFSLLFFLLICLLSLIPISIWNWNNTVKKISEVGPRITKHRLEQAIGHKIQLSGTSLSFPLAIKFDNFSIFRKKNNNLFFKTPQIEVDFSIISLLLGKLRPKTIKIVAPEIDIYRTTKGAVSFGQSNSFAKIAESLKEKPPGKYSYFSPTSWPVIINPNVIEIVDGNIHLEDELDSLPQLDGNFQLYLERFTEQNQISIKNSRLTFNKTPFFYHGLQGTISGSVNFTSNDVTLKMEVTIADGGTLNIVGKINDYHASSRSSFELKSESFDLRILALTKLPLLTLSENASLSANFKISKPILYGKQLESLTATILYNKGQWRVDAIDLQLLNSSGKIGGSIVPRVNTQSNLSTVTLLYQGTVPPPLQLKNTLINELSPNSWTNPITISSSMILDSSTYPLLINEIKLTSSNGDFFGKGNIDLFSGFAELRGTYLKPTTSNSYATTSQKDNSNAVDISILGPITTPEISATPEIE